MNDEVIHRSLTQWRENIQFIFCLGHNDKIRRKMQLDPRFNHPNIHIFGFTREIDKLMEVSNLLITKPGGMTCTEGLAKGIPMLFHKPLLDRRRKIVNTLRLKATENRLLRWMLS